MSKRKWRWVTLDSETPGYVNIWLNFRPTPKQNEISGEWNVANTVDEEVVICPREFKKITGITVPTDKPIKVEFTAKVVE